MKESSWYMVYAETFNSPSSASVGYLTLCKTVFVQAASGKEALDTALNYLTQGGGYWTVLSVTKAIRECNNVQQFMATFSIGADGKLVSKLTLRRRFPVASFDVADPDGIIRTKVCEIRSKGGATSDWSYLRTYDQVVPPEDTLNDSCYIRVKGDRYLIGGMLIVPTGESYRSYTQNRATAEFEKYLKSEIDKKLHLLNQLQEAQ